VIIFGGGSPEAFIVWRLRKRRRQWLRTAGSHAKWRRTTRLVWVNETVESAAVNK
jgi:hypothetical protein